MSTEKPTKSEAKVEAKTDAKSVKAEAKNAEEKTPSKRTRATARAKAKRQPDPMRRRRVIRVLVVILAVIVMLYRPARDYYIAWRTGYTLTVRYEALAEENEELNDDLERLMTREGIEDAARERGYVMPGETSVKVEGLDENVGEESSGKAADVTGEEDLPWYIHVGDFIFFYRSES